MLQADLTCRLLLPSARQINDVPRKTPPRDPKLDHPAVQLYIDICHSTPNHCQRELIVAAITKLDLYEEILRKFMSEGRPPQRVDWTLERYENAIKALAVGAVGRPTSDAGRGSSPTVKEGFFTSAEEEDWVRNRVGAG